METEFKNNNIAILTNPKDDLDARITLLATIDGKKTNYFLFDFYFESTKEEYFSVAVTASSKTQKVNVKNRTVTMYALAPSADGRDKGIDLYNNQNSESPADYMNHANHMMKGFFVTKKYKNSLWHLNPEKVALTEQQKAVHDKLDEVNQKLADRRSVKA